MERVIITLLAFLNPPIDWIPMGVVLRNRRRKIFWISGVCIGTLWAMEEEMGHERASQNLPKRLPPA